MTTLFQAVDPLGRTVTCTKERWDAHVLLEREHLEMAGNEEQARLAVAEPIAIYQSSTPGLIYTRYLYFRVSELPAPHDRGFVLVVADLVPTAPNVQEGRFVTAYHSFDGPSHQDELIWPTT